MKETEGESEEIKVGKRGRRLRGENDKRKRESRKRVI